MKQRIYFCTSRDGIRIAYVAAGQGPPLLRLNNWFTHLEIDRASTNAHVPPPAGVKSPALWGTRARLDELFGDDGEVRAEPRMFVFRYRSAQHWLEVFRTYYGPMVKAFGALDAGKQEALAADMIAPTGRFSHAKDGSGQRLPWGGHHQALMPGGLALLVRPRGVPALRAECHPSS